MIWWSPRQNTVSGTWKSNSTQQHVGGCNCMSRLQIRCFDTYILICCIIIHTYIIRAQIVILSSLSITWGMYHTCLHWGSLQDILSILDIHVSSMNRYHNIIIRSTFITYDQIIGNTLNYVRLIVKSYSNHQKPKKLLKKYVWIRGQIWACRCFGTPVLFLSYLFIYLFNLFACLFGFFGGWWLMY